MVHEEVDPAEAADRSLDRRLKLGRSDELAGLRVSPLGRASLA